jgi:uncharacterized protein YcbK (DUF882 family)
MLQLPPPSSDVSLADPLRRQWLGRLLALSLAASGLPRAHASLDDLWQRPRQLRLRRMQTGEAVQIMYWYNDELHQEGYAAVNRMLRDVHANQSVPMDLTLLNLMFGIQEWLAAQGHHAVLHIHSGYRSPQTNARTEGASRHSMHLQGKAVDFHVPGVSGEQLWRMTSFFRAGGAGVYPGRGFIHADTGTLRHWRA